MIRQAINSKLFDYVVVSTDSLQIKKISEKFGAKVYFLRPKKISNSKAKTQDVITHAINWFKKKNIFFEFICCLYPTSVLTTAKDLKNSFKLLKNKKFSFIISAQKYSTQIQRSFRIINKKIVLTNKKKFKENSQNFEDYYHDAGQFYWGTFKAWHAKNTLLDNKSSIYELKKYQVVDINTPDDWRLAEKLYRLNKYF